MESLAISHNKLARFLVYLKVRNKLDAPTIGRYGDTSLRSFLAINANFERPGFVTVCSVSDKEKEFESPSPRFATAFGGGRSPYTHQALETLMTSLQDSVQEAGATQVKISALSMAGKDDAYLLLQKNPSGDITVTTCDTEHPHGEAKVFFNLTDARCENVIKQLLKLCDALQRDNRKDFARAAGFAYIEWSRQKGFP